MKGFMITLFIICLCSLVFAGNDKVYTDTDLGKYRSAPSESTETETKEPSKKKQTLVDIQKEMAFREQLNAYNYQIGLAKDLRKFSTQITYQQKRAELKIKVIETYGFLPLWWKEE